VHFVGLNVANRLSTVHGMNSIKFKVYLLRHRRESEHCDFILESSSVCEFAIVTHRG
jgi:hypothetical protein